MDEKRRRERQGSVDGKRKSEQARKKRKKEKRNGENAELPKNGGEILRDRLKSRIKKSAGSEKNEEKGRYAKRIKPRKTMI